MSVTFRNYAPGAGETADYLLLHDFLAKEQCVEFTYARLDWMITHPCLKPECLPLMGLWFDSGELIAAAMFDCTPDDIFFQAKKGYEYLYADMIAYARDNMSPNPDDSSLALPDNNRLLQHAAMKLGYTATRNKEFYAVYDSENPPADPRATLKEGFSLVSLADERDFRKYSLCLHKGFGHEENGEPFEYYEDFCSAAMLRPHVDLNLKIAAKAPNGEFAAYCGMWYDENAGFAVIEPVATAPEYRRMGLGRACVLEGVRRCFEKGAKSAFVGSEQQFYYSIGLRPHSSTTFWKRG